MTKTNIHSRYGEIDLLGVKDNSIYIFEVKSTTKSYRYNLETLDSKKFYKLLKTFNNKSLQGYYNFGGIFYVEIVWSNNKRYVINQAYYETHYEDWN